MAKVLIIEDDVNYCFLVERALTQEGFEVCTAANLKDGLQCVHRDHPDAIVLDLGLPDSPVEETVSRVKLAADSAIIVVLSGNAHAAEDCISKSASGFIDKNAGLKYITTEIRNAIRTFRKIREIDSAIQSP